MGCLDRSGSYCVETAVGTRHLSPPGVLAGDTLASVAVDSGERVLISDTDPEAHDVQTAAYRRMTGAQRSAIMFRLNEMARNIAAAGIRARHPDYSEQQVRRALLRLLVGDDLARAVEPGVPLLDP